MRWRWVGAGLLALRQLPVPLKTPARGFIGAHERDRRVNGRAAADVRPGSRLDCRRDDDGSSKVVDTVATPVVPELATVDDDGTVSWNYESPLIDQRVRRYLLDPAPDGFVVSEGGETPTDLPAARALTGIFAIGGAADPLITVTITSPAIAGVLPTLDGVSGEPVTVGDVAAVQRSLGVTGVGLVFVLGGHRVDVVARVACSSGWRRWQRRSPSTVRWCRSGCPRAAA